MSYSIIIPYQHIDERKELFYACIVNLIKLSNNTFELCVHEVGESPTLQLPNKIKYLFTEYKGIFHRAWAINRCVRELPTSKMLILMDGDLILTNKWFQAATKCTSPSVGWNRLHLLDIKGTEQYLKTGCINESCVEHTKTPSVGSAAGGITIIPRKLFMDMKGIPEDFYGSWGGEDNAFWSKLTSFGYKFRSLKAPIYHLSHSRSTPRVTSIQRKAISMYYWTSSQWKNHVDAISEWGGAKPSTGTLPSFDYISTNNNIKLTIAMLSWLRFDKLIQTLTSLNETLSIPVNIILMVQGSERLNDRQKKLIKKLSSRFTHADVFFTQGNVGTGPARRTLVERALRRFNTPYISLADDDTTFTPGSIESTIELMDKDKSIGIAGIRYKPKVYRLDSHYHPCVLAPVDATESCEQVDSTGSASALIRNEVFDLCSIDPEYKLGQWDLDLCLQARSVGWKIVNYQAFAGMRAINNFGGCKEYRQGRMNRQEINKSVKRFKQKWGLVKAV